MMFVAYSTGLIEMNSQAYQLPRPTLQVFRSGEELLHTDLLIRNASPANSNFTWVTPGRRVCDS